MPLYSFINHNHDLIFIIINLSIIFIILTFNEFVVSKRLSHYEFSRKFAHISIGCLVAFWPFYISLESIRLISLVLLAVVIVTKFSGRFKSIHNVDRFTLGELGFAISVGLLTYITTNHAIYALAILVMSLADGLAAIIGVKWGESSQYTVFGQLKSLIGSAIFLITSFVLLVIFNFLTKYGLSISLLALISLASLLFENISLFGLDNILIPVVIASLVSIL